MKTKRELEGTKEETSGGLRLTLSPFSGSSVLKTRGTVEKEKMKSCLKVKRSFLSKYQKRNRAKKWSTKKK